MKLTWGHWTAFRALSLTPGGSQRNPKATKWPLRVSPKHCEAAPRAFRRMPQGTHEAPERSLGTHGRWITGPTGEDIPGTWGSLGTLRDSQALRDPWESPSASLDPLEIAIHNSLACGFHHGTCVPLSHWYQSLEASTSPQASGSPNVVGAGRVGCGKAVGGSKPVGRAAVIGT